MFLGPPGSEPRGEGRADRGPGRGQRLWEVHHCPAPPALLRPRQGIGEYNTPYEGLNIVNQIGRKLGVFCPKFEGSHSTFKCIYRKKQSNYGKI